MHEFRLFCFYWHGQKQNLMFWKSLEIYTYFQKLMTNIFSMTFGRDGTLSYNAYNIWIEFVKFSPTDSIYLKTFSRQQNTSLNPKEIISLKTTMQLKLLALFFTISFTLVCAIIIPKGKINIYLLKLLFFSPKKICDGPPSQNENNQNCTKWVH